VVGSDARNKELALGRIKRLASSGLPVEPFARAVLEQLHSAIPNSPNRAFFIAAANHADCFIAGTSDTAGRVPAFQHYFVENPAQSGCRFVQDPITIRRLLPRQTVWRHEEIMRSDCLKTDGFNEVMRPLEWRQLLQVIFRVDHDLVGYVPLWRAEGDKDYTRADERFLLAASPHITHGLKIAQLQDGNQLSDNSVSSLAGWSAGAILLDEKHHPIALDRNARLIFEQMGGLDGIGADGFHLPQISDAFAYVAATLREIFHDPDSGLTNSAPPVARVYAHWSGIVLKLRGLRMTAADGRAYTTVLVERGETAAARRRRMLARWGLSQREGEVLDLICDNKTGPEIAILLTLSHNTVRKHTSSILAKLGIETRAAAIAAVRDFT